MKRNIVIILFAISWITGLWAKDGLSNGVLDICSESPEVSSSFSGYEITPKGAWCWFADPRALHYENQSGTIRSTYIGYIDVHGNIKATQYDHLTNQVSEVLIRSYFQPDDHDNPTFLVLPDERIMIFYSRHTDQPCFYYRVSRKAGDITTLGEEKKLMTKNNTTYPSPFILSSDPDHIYLCWRGIKWHPTIARILIPDRNGDTNFDWGPYQMVQSTGARPYAKYMSNGKDKIYMTYTTGHPDNEQPNHVYFNYVDINDMKLKDIQGKELSIIQNAPHRVNKKSDYISVHPAAVVDHSNFRNWVWELALDAHENPVIAMVRISPDKTKHDYYYVKWTGNEWRKTYLAHAGKHFHQTPDTERCYSGGMSIDKRFPEQIYCSVPVKGDHGTVYEIVKYSVDVNGKVKQEAVTYHSKKNNVRPYCIQHANNRSLGMVKLEMEVDGLPDWQTNMLNPDFAQVAEAMGMTGFNVSNPEEVLTTLLNAFELDGPVLVNIMTDPNALAMPPKIEFGQMVGFAQSMYKLLINGRSQEVIDTINSNFKHIREVF